MTTLLSMPLNVIRIPSGSPMTMTTAVQMMTRAIVSMASSQSLRQIITYIPAIAPAVRSFRLLMT